MLISHGVTSEIEKSYEYEDESTLIYAFKKIKWLTYKDLCALDGRLQKCNNYVQKVVTPKSWS